MKTIDIHGEYYNENPYKVRETCRAIIIRDDNILISYETKTDQLMLPGGGLELKEFIATSNGHDYYEFLVSNLRPNECKWLCYGILVKPVNNTIKITYYIRSTYFTGNLKGNFEYNIS